MNSTEALEAQPAKLKVEFGKPAHGWLPVVFTLADFSLEFEASWVLNDPLTDLVSCLLLVTQGADASVSWWLEPAEFLFQFGLTPSGIQLAVVESDDMHSVQPMSKRQLFHLEASYETVVLPFWRALRKLNPTDFDEEHWYPLPLEKLEKLTQLIKLRRQTK